MKLIGIDTGTHTGVAIYETISKRIERLETLPIHKAMALVLATALENPNDTHVYFEDARLRKWFGRSGREQLQGAGSIKRDCAIWEEEKQEEHPYSLQKNLRISGLTEYAQ